MMMYPGHDRRFVLDLSFEEMQHLVAAVNYCERLGWLVPASDNAAGPALVTKVRAVWADRLEADHAAGDHATVEEVLQRTAESEWLFDDERDWLKRAQRHELSE
jgi:hypothetical protein